MLPAGLHNDFRIISPTASRIIREQRATKKQCYGKKIVAVEQEPLVCKSVSKSVRIHFAHHFFKVVFATSLKPKGDSLPPLSVVLDDSPPQKLGVNVCSAIHLYDQRFTLGGEQNSEEETQWDLSLIAASVGVGFGGAGGELSSRLLPGLCAGRALVKGSRWGAEQRCRRSTQTPPRPLQRTEAGQAEDGYGSDGSYGGRPDLLGARYQRETWWSMMRAQRRRDICPGLLRCAWRLNHFIFIMS